MGRKRLFVLKGKDIDDYQKFIDKLREKGLDHLFDDPDSCHQLYNIGIRKCIECISFAWSESEQRIYQINTYTTEYYYEPEKNIMEVEAERIDSISIEDWREYWLHFLKLYAEEYIEKIRKAYNLN